MVFKKPKIQAKRKQYFNSKKKEKSNKTTYYDDDWLNFFKRSFFPVYVWCYIFYIQTDEKTCFVSTSDICAENQDLCKLYVHQYEEYQFLHEEQSREEIYGCIIQNHYSLYAHSSRYSDIIYSIDLEYYEDNFGLDQFPNNISYLCYDDFPSPPKTLCPKYEECISNPVRYYFNYVMFLCPLIYIIIYLMLVCNAVQKQHQDKK